MTVKKADVNAAVSSKLEEIAAKATAMQARVAGGDADIGEDARELDRLVRELKALLGQSAFDRTAYQREYMRKKRTENPDYRPIIEPVRDLPDWRKPPLK